MQTASPSRKRGLKVLPTGNKWRTIQRILVISEYNKNSGWYAISLRPLVSIWHMLSHQNFRKTKTSTVIRLIRLKQRPRGLHWPKVTWPERQDLNSGLLDLRALKRWGLFCACVSEWPKRGHAGGHSEEQEDHRAMPATSAVPQTWPELRPT